MKNSKTIIATLATLMILLPMFSAIIPTNAVVNDPPAWYTVTNGVLDSDYYMLYPFEPNSVSYGFSKFGELLGILPGQDQSAQANWVGMMYDGRDPFAPLDTVPMTSWINGWYLTLSYIDPAVSGITKDRYLFAFAMFADGYTAGGDWQTATTPSGAPHGGRKTNGLVTTDPLKVLYDGPRRFIAQSVNHVFDREDVTTWPVVDLTLTMIFDKVDKQVILLKDVKITLPKMHIFGKLNVQLSNREEYDLGPSPGYASYAHYYEQYGITSYNSEWHMAQNLTRDHFEHQVGNGSKTVFTLAVPGGCPLSIDWMKIYIDDVFQDPSISPPPYTINYGAKTVTFASAPASSSDVKFLYKYVFKDNGTDRQGVSDWDNKYDIAQVISSDGAIVAWTGLWPPTSSFTVDGILRFLQPMYDIKETDMSSEPKQSPLIIGQWDFALDHATMPMFRGVEVKGIANLHNADDEQYGGYNILDTEACFQLDKVFLPWDLNSAVEKKLNTWVQFYTITEEDYNQIVNLGHSITIALDYIPVHFASTWEAYNSNAERVILGDVLQYPTRQVTTVGYSDDYELSVDSDGFGTITFWNSVVVGQVIKIIYATDVEYAQPEFDITYTQTGLFGNSSGLFATHNIDDDLDSYWVDPLGVYHDVYADEFDFSVANVSTAGAFPTDQNLTFTYTGPTMEWGADPFKVFKEDYTTLEIGSDADNIQTINATQNASYAVTINVTAIVLDWEIGPAVRVYPPELFTDMLDTHFYGWNFDVTPTITITYSNATGRFTLTETLSFEAEDDEYILYTEVIPGRYEWGVVGRDAASVDSAGLSLISAAFKNKQVEYGIAGEDMYDPEIANQIPWMMSKMGAGTSKADYYYGESDFRTALQDDFCTTWQITRANLIGSGGPIANLLAYYGNDFADAFFGLDQFTSYTTWENKIIALTCWNGTKKGFTNTNTIGYAVVSTFEDINGTNIFLVWGNWGRDTFYAAKWFHEDGIREFQDFPAGATSIVLKITYANSTEGYKPTAYNVIEVLGTISETLVYDSYLQIYKGGIHDP